MSCNHTSIINNIMCIYLLSYYSNIQHVVGYNVIYKFALVLKGKSDENECFWVWKCWKQD